MVISSSEYLMKDCKMIPVDMLQKAIRDFYENSTGGDSYLRYKDMYWSTDVGYAFDGVHIILEVLEAELGVELIPDEQRG